MSAPHDTSTRDDQPISVRGKLAVAWASFVLLYAYVDILAFYKPGVVDDILNGIVWQFDITPTWAITALTLLAIPMLMVVLSVALPARAARITNLIVVLIQIPFAVFNVAGEFGADWMPFYLLGVALELFVLGLILRWAWTWPRAAAPSAPHDARENGRPTRQR